MVTGAAASIVYGEPRLTNDIDVVIALTPTEVEPFLNSLRKTNQYVYARPCGSAANSKL